MEETDKTTISDGTEQPAPEAQADNLTTPAPPDITDTSGDVVIPSNVIDGLYVSLFRSKIVNTHFSDAILIDFEALFL